MRLLRARAPVFKYKPSWSMFDAPWDDFVSDSRRALILIDDDTDEDFIGYVIYESSEEEQNLHINYIEVSPDYQGQGCGKVLLSRAIKETLNREPDIKTVDLWAREEALGFYRALDFLPAPGNSKSRDGTKTLMIKYL